MTDNEYEDILDIFSNSIERCMNNTIHLAISQRALAIIMMEIESMVSHIEYRQIVYDILEKYPNQKVVLFLAEDVIDGMEKLLEKVKEKRNTECYTVKNMKKIDITTYRKERAKKLMDIFLDYSHMARNRTCAGHKFEQVHEAQIVGAQAVNDLYQEGLLDIAQELYPHETENLKEYLEIFNEIASGKKQ
jgi:hypothetical protein